MEANFEKISKREQWQGRQNHPVMTRTISRVEIEELRCNLVASYGCPNADITFDFQRINDEADEDRFNCLYLKYKLKCINAGKPTVREIFSLKIPVPEEVLLRAEKMKGGK